MEVGALTSGPTDQLTTVDQVDPIYVYFNPSDQDVLQWRRDIAAKRLVLPRGVLDVQATLADGSVFGQTGKLDFVALALQANTGALQLRAEFPNPQHTLLPGQFVRVRLLGLKRNDAILVPQRAVQQGLNGPFVYVLGDSNKVSARPVAATAWQGTQWIIERRVSVRATRSSWMAPRRSCPMRPVRPVAYDPETRQHARGAARHDGHCATLGRPADPGRRPSAGRPAMSDTRPRSGICSSGDRSSRPSSRS